MADLERHAFKRDKRYVVRLVLLMLIGLLVGGFLYAKLTSTDVGSCAARTFQGATGGEQGAP